LGVTQRLALTRTSQARENDVCVSSPPPLGLGENRVFDDDMCTPKTPPHTPGQCGHSLHSGTPPLAQPPQRPPQTRGTQTVHSPTARQPHSNGLCSPPKGGADLAFTRYCFMSRLLNTNQYYYLQTAPWFGHPPPHPVAHTVAQYSVPPRPPLVTIYAM